MRRWFLSFLLIALVIYGAWRWQVPGATRWQTVAPGVEMRTFRVAAPGTFSGTAEVVALRTDPSRIRVAHGQLRDVAAWRKDLKAVAVINGGFFDEDGKSLGLRVVNNKKTRPIHDANWGVFYIRKGKANILHTRDFKRTFTSLRLIQQAVQCGPRLVVDGKTTDLKPQHARRSGIGVQRDGKVIIAIADGSLAFDSWAKLWASRDGLNCRDALNLDGGGSTALSLQTSKSNKEVSGAWPVPDVVAIR